MNKHIKLVLCLGLLGLSGSVYAEGNCPSGYYPIGDANTHGCAPIPGAENQQSSYQQATPLPPVPAGEWKEAWGAVAVDSAVGVIGTVTNSTDRDNAESAAIADCRAKGGKSCRIDLTYANQCGVMIAGASRYRMETASTIEEATIIGMKECKANDTNCRVYYSACSKPRFVKY